MESPGPTPEGLGQVWTGPAHGSQWRATELAHLLYPWIQTRGSHMGSQGTDDMAPTLIPVVLSWHLLMSMPEAR